MKGEEGISLKLEEADRATRWSFGIGILTTLIIAFVTALHPTRPAPAEEVHTMTDKREDKGPSSKPDYDYKSLTGIERLRPERNPGSSTGGDSGQQGVESGQQGGNSQQGQADSGNTSKP